VASRIARSSLAFFADLDSISSLSAAAAPLEPFKPFDPLALDARRPETIDALGSLSRLVPLESEPRLFALLPLFGDLAEAAIPHDANDRLDDVDMASGGG
jgi:hypothetical protein